MACFLRSNFFEVMLTVMTCPAGRSVVSKRVGGEVRGSAIHGELIATRVMISLMVFAVILIGVEMELLNCASMQNVKEHAPL